MKRLVLTMLGIASISMMLAGCGSTTSNTSTTGSDEGAGTTVNEEVKEDNAGGGDISNAVSVALGNDYSNSNGIEFKLYKIATSSKLQAVSGSGSYYEADNGINYVDLILTMNNNGTEEWEVRDRVTGFLELEDGTKYDDLLVAVESDVDRVDQFGTLKPLTTNKVHIGYKVPSNITAGTLYFALDGEYFAIDYDASVEVSSKVAIGLNEEIRVEDVAVFELLSTGFTNDVLPPNTSGVYTHYQIDDPANDTYFVVYANLSNESTSGIDADEMMSVRAIFDGKYEYRAQMVLEEKDGTGFDPASITDVEPLETRKAVFMFEFPKKVQEMESELSIYFYGNEYSYK